jgi:hypothetical protein
MNAECWVLFAALMIVSFALRYEITQKERWRALAERQFKRVADRRGRAVEGENT